MAAWPGLALACQSDAAGSISAPDRRNRIAPFAPSSSVTFGVIRTPLRGSRGRERSADEWGSAGAAPDGLAAPRTGWGACQQGSALAASPGEQRRAHCRAAMCCWRRRHPPPPLG